MTAFLYILLIFSVLAACANLILLGIIVVQDYKDSKEKEQDLEVYDMDDESGGLD